MSRTENAVKSAIRKKLHEYGIYRTEDFLKNQYSNSVGWYHMPVPSRYSEAGIGDFQGLVHGKWFEIETKKPKGGKHKGNQKLRQRVVTAAGGIYILATSADDILFFLGLVKMSTLSYTRSELEAKIIDPANTDVVYLEITALITGMFDTAGIGPNDLIPYADMENVARALSAHALDMTDPEDVTQEQLQTFAEGLASV